MNRSRVRLLAGAVSCLIVAVPLSAQNQLSTGGGPGSVTVTVDGWGMFGGCPNQAFHSDAMHTSATGLGPYPTTCYSAILLDDVTGCPAPGRTLLALTDPFYTQFPSQAVNPPVTVLNPGRHIQTASQQVVCGLQVSVDQRLDGPDPIGGAYEGSTLVQTYTITNTGATPRVLNLIRFVDVDLSSNFTANRGGASRRLADCGNLAPPFVSNKEWVFEFDPNNAAGILVAIGAEGLDANGQPTQTTAYRVHASAVGHPSSAFYTNPVGFLNNTIDQDGNGDLVVTPPELPGDFALFQGLNLTAPPGGTVIGVFRTRWTSLDPGSQAPIETQAREITCTGWLGNYSGAGFFPILCVNAQNPCASVAPGAQIDVTLGPTFAGPAPADYIVFGTFGQSMFGTGCGSPQAADAAFWGPPFGIIGFGAFPVSSVISPWSGGGSPAGAALISSLPGLALITGPPANSAPTPCGGATILSIPGILPAGFSVTLQAVIIDFGGLFFPATVSNAVNLTIGCPCQTH